MFYNTRFFKHANGNRSFLLGVLFVCFSLFSQAQIDQSDIIEVGNAAARKADFEKRFKGAGWAPTKAVRFSVAELQAVLDQYKAAGISEISFESALIRNDDAKKYEEKFIKKGKLEAKHRGMIANRQTLLIKVPQDGSASLKSLPFVQRYYDIGQVCPPPEGCDN